MYIKFTTAFLLLFFIFLLNARAQNYNSINLLEETIKEKIKFPEDYLKRLLEGKTEINYFQAQDNQSQSKNDRLQSKFEMEVSLSNLVESEIHAAINPLDTSNIIISPIRQNPGNQTQAISCPVYYTKDFGKTWDVSIFETKPLRKNVMLFGGGDPVLTYDSDGNAYHTWINVYFTLTGNNYDSVFADMYWAKSVDGGENWNRVQNDLVGAVSGKYTINSTYGLDRMLDKQWIAVDRSNSPYRNNLYVVLTEITSGFSNNSKIKLFKKPANSNSFLSESVQINKNTYNLVQFSSIDVDHKGTIHVTFYGNNGLVNSLYYSNSTDGGNTFSKEIKVTDFTFAGSRLILGNQNDRVVGMSQQRFYPCPILAVDKSGTSSYSGNLYLVWTANGVTSVKGDGMDIYFSSSSDNGKTWSPPIVINDDEKGSKVSQYYPSITVNNRGIVIVCWYDRRKDSLDNHSHYYMTASFDGGKTFIENYQITGKESNFSRIGTKNNSFGIGEYNQVVATDYYAIPVWADGRTNDGNIKIYTAFIPLDENLLSVEKISNIYNTLSIDEIYPNPSRNRINVKLKGTLDYPLEIKILDFSGSIVKSFNHIQPENNTLLIELNLENLSNGVYFLRITNYNNYILRKFIIQK